MSEDVKNPIISLLFNWEQKSHILCLLICYPLQIQQQKGWTWSMQASKMGSMKLCTVKCHTN